MKAKKAKSTKSTKSTKSAKSGASKKTTKGASANKNDANETTAIQPQTVGIGYPVSQETFGKMKDAAKKHSKE